MKVEKVFSQNCIFVRCQNPNTSYLSRRSRFRSRVWRTKSPAKYDVMKRKTKMKGMLEDDPQIRESDLGLVTLESGTRTLDS